MSASPATAIAPEPTSGDVNPPATGPRSFPWFPVLAFLGVGVPLFVLVAVSPAWTFPVEFPTPATHPHRWLAGWTRWDAGWYVSIAENGYYYSGPGVQASVAFWPAYPAVLRVLGLAIPSTWVAGTVATFLSGLGSAVLLYKWCELRLPRRSSRIAVLALLLYPFSWFLFGAVYSDALFLCATIGAFYLVERDRPVLAGVVAVFATAARPVGPFIVLGLVLLVIERRGVLRFDGLQPRLDLARLEPRHVGVLLSALGFLAYLAYLEWRFDTPWAFLHVQSAPGWDHDVGLRDVVKIDFARYLWNWTPDLPHFTQGTQALACVVALLLVPAVVRRFGWAYGAFVLLIVAFPASTTKDFVGMGRYLLAAFPCFAAAGDLLARRPVLAGVPVGALSAVALGSYTSLFARTYMIS